jgi:hypothetical protein
MKALSLTFKSLASLTLVVCLLAFSFWIYFDLSKHAPGLAQVNPFAEDPFDAVGSFGVQLTTFCVMIAFVRTVRPHPDGITLDRAALILKANTVALVSIMVTLFADLIALFLYPEMWLPYPAGWVLAGLMCLLLLGVVLVLFLDLRRIQTFIPVPEHRPWEKMIAVCLVGSLLLVLYLPGWRESLLGGLFAAVLGMSFLMLATWTVARVIFPEDITAAEDILDDLAALYRWLTEHARFTGSFFRLLESYFRLRWVRAISLWLNPRRHPWNIVVLAALGMGAALLVTDAIVEGAPQQDKLLLVVAVVLGIEGGGVLLGYILFRQFLGLFRKEI